MSLALLSSCNNFNIAKKDKCCISQSVLMFVHIYLDLWVFSRSYFMILIISCFVKFVVQSNGIYTGKTQKTWGEQLSTSLLTENIITVMFKSVDSSVDSYVSCLLRVQCKAIQLYQLYLIISLSDLSDASFSQHWIEWHIS